MYIRKCDRCGKEHAIKNLLTVFGDALHEDGLRPAFAITRLYDSREITLCPECETKLSAWIFGAPKTCCHCAAKAYDPDRPIDDSAETFEGNAKGAWFCTLTHQLIDNTKRDEFCPLDADESTLVTKTAPTAPGLYE